MMTSKDRSEKQAVADEKNPRRPSNFDQTKGAIQVDPFVQQWVAATNGKMYLELIGKLERYPIPVFPLPAGSWRRLLDLGCGWGRWSIAAGEKRYRPVGIDIQFEAVSAARRVASQHGVVIDVVVADVCYLPFRDDAFDVVFSYSVLQHLHKPTVEVALNDVRRVLKAGGQLLIELPNKFGLRNLISQFRRRFKTPEPDSLQVRYWGPREIRQTFERCGGKAVLSADGFFSINPQLADIDMLPVRFKWLVIVSEALKGMTHVIRVLRLVADSLYVSVVNSK